MFPTTRVVELSWLARCVVRPARPTAFNRCVCSPFLASVSLCTYRVFGNCRIQPERNNRVPRHEARLDLPFDLPSSPLRAILFVSVSFFFSFPFEADCTYELFPIAVNANRPWWGIKTSLKGLLQERLNLKHLEKRVGCWGLYSVS